MFALTLPSLYNLDVYGKVNSSNSHATVSRAQTKHLFPLNRHYRSPPSDATPMAATEIQDLPPEIILKVFLAFLGPRSSKRGGVEDLLRRRRPVLLTHICQQWRTHALSYPFLWNDIQIHGTSELFLSFFERSHPLPVDLTVRASAYRSCSKIAPLLYEKLKSLGETHLRRIRSIAMLDMHRLAICDVLAAVDGMALPALEALSLRGKGRADTAHDTHIPFLTHANAILSVTLSNMCISCIPGQQTLTTLELLTFPPSFDAAALRDLIESFPALSTLVIGDVQMAREGDGPSQVEPPIINAPNLKTLVVTPQAIISNVSWGTNIQQTCHPFCHCTLRNLIAENLEYLEVCGGCVGSALSHLVPFIRLRTQSEDKPPLRLMLNGIEDIQPLHDIPRHLFLHLAPSFIGQPSLYTFTKEFLGSVLYIPAYKDLASEFDISEDYCRVPESRVAFRPPKSKEGPREPLCDPTSFRVPSPFENDVAYEAYWRAPTGLGDFFGLFARDLWEDSDSNSDGIVHPYGWQESDEDEEYENHDAEWNDWDLEDLGMALEYDDDPVLFEGTEEPENPTSDVEGEDINPHESSEDQGLTFGDHLQTGVIYHDEDTLEYYEQTGVIYDEGEIFGHYVGTGVLYTEGPAEYEQTLSYHDEDGYPDHDPEVHEDYWLGGDVQLENEQEAGSYDEGNATGDDAYYQEEVAVDIYPFEDVEYVQDYGEVVSDDLGVEFGGYGSPDPADGQSDYGYDSGGEGGYDEDYGYGSDDY